MLMPTPTGSLLSNSDSGSKAPVGAIVGGAVGGAVATIIFVVILLYVRWRRRRSPSSPYSQAVHVRSGSNGGAATPDNFSRSVEPFPPPMPVVGM